MVVLKRTRVAVMVRQLHSLFLPPHPSDVLEPRGGLDSLRAVLFRGEGFLLCGGVGIGGFHRNVVEARIHTARGIMPFQSVVAVHAPSAEQRGQHTPSQKPQDEGRQHEQDEGDHAEQKPQQADHHGGEDEEQDALFPGIGALPCRQNSAQPREETGGPEVGQGLGENFSEQG